MKRLNVFAVFMLILCLSLLNVVNIESKDFSQRENRELAAAPDFSFGALFDGSFFSGMTDYLTDRFFQRDKMVEMSAKIKAALADNPFKEAAMVNDGKKISVIKLDDTGNPVVRYGDSMFFVFKSSNANINRYTKALNSLFYQLDNVNTSVMLVPTALEFIEDSEELFGVTSQKEQIEYAKKTLNNGINMINVYDSLKEHKDEYIYFRSDHHWTLLGAYYAYSAFAQHQGIEPVELNLELAGNFRGSFFDYTNDPSVSDITDVMSLYSIEAMNWCHGSLLHAEDSMQMEKMYHEDHEGYKIVFGGDTGYIRVETMNKTEKRLMIIKDSYANALVPYFTEYYNRIIMIDPRYFKDDIYQTIANEGITDLLFVNNTETISDNDYISKLEQLADKENV